MHSRHICDQLLKKTTKPQKGEQIVTRVLDLLLSLNIVLTLFLYSWGKKYHKEEITAKYTIEQKMP